LEDRTDVGNANLLVRLTEGNLRFVPERKLWLCWEDDSWHEDLHGALAQKAALRVAEFYNIKLRALEARASDSALEAGERKSIETAVASLAKWEKHCRRKQTIDAMLVIASRFEHVQISIDELNKDPFLLGVQNGVVDLRAGELRAAARDDFVTKRCAVAFNPEANAPRWVQLIHEITGAPLPLEFDAAGAVVESSVGRYRKRPDRPAKMIVVRPDILLDAVHSSSMAPGRTARTS